MYYLLAANHLVDAYNRAFPPNTVGAVILTLCLVISTGIALGNVRVFGVSLGIAGVLFTGLFFGQIGFHLESKLLDFVRDFGQILYVFTVGLQVGPGFFSSLRRHGLKFNMMAAAIVGMGAAMAVGLWWSASSWLSTPASVGLFCGSTTNTPSLAAAQQALLARGYTDADSSTTGLAYAIAYPGGLIGVIFVMLLIRAIFRIDPQKENEALRRTQAGQGTELSTLNLEVVNENLDGMALADIPAFRGSGVIISRLLRSGKVKVAQPNDVLRMGDVLLAVGPKEKLYEMLLAVGRPSALDLRDVPSEIVARRVIVTHRAVLGKSIDELALLEHYGVVITRVIRAEVELTAMARLKLQFGDRVQAVGEPSAIDAVARQLGDSVKDLDRPQVLSIFVGIVIGVLFGSLPIPLPGISTPVRLGLAGGPLLVALVLSRINRIGPVIWYLPTSANYALREVGIGLFLACVGLKAGGQFLETVRQGYGLYWVGLGILITLVPLLVMSLFARLVMRMNYLSLCGLMAGSMTDSPSLAFATTIAGPEGPSVPYATVYPLALILRVLSAQLMVLLLPFVK